MEAKFDRFADAGSHHAVGHGRSGRSEHVERLEYLRDDHPVVGRHETLATGNGLMERIGESSSRLKHTVTAAGHEGDIRRDQPIRDHEAGMALIVACGLYAAHREALRAGTLSDNARTPAP